jgi:hypothetical protein
VNQIGRVADPLSGFAAYLYRHNASFAIVDVSNRIVSVWVFCFSLGIDVYRMDQSPCPDISFAMVSMTSLLGWNGGFRHCRDTSLKRKIIDKPEMVAAFLEISDHLLTCGEDSVLLDLLVCCHKDLGNDGLIANSSRQSCELQTTHALVLCGVCRDLRWSKSARPTAVDRVTSWPRHPTIDTGISDRHRHHQ